MIYENIKFNGKLSSGSRVFACGRTDRQTDGRTDMMNLIRGLGKYEL